MQVNGLFVSLIILLIPGIIATLILDATMQHEKWDNFLFSIYVILFGFFSYFVLFITTLPLSLTPCIAYQFKGFEVFSSLKTADSVKLNYWEMGFACIIAILLSLLASYAVNHKWLTRLANKYNISNKYGDENLFYYYLNRDGVDWLYIRDFPRKMTYSGRLSTFSENDGIQELALFDVEVYGLENGKLYGHIETIYLCGKAGDFAIESPSVQKRQESKNGETS